MTDTTPEMSRRRARRRRWVPWLMAAVVVAAGATLGVIVVGDGDDSTPSAVTSELPDPLDSSNDPDTAELAQLLAEGRGATYHASYRTTGAAETGVGETTLEVWRAGSRLRQDTAATIDGQEVATASFLDGPEAVVCSNTGDAGWVCTSSEATGSEADGLFGSIRDQLAGSSVTPRDDELRGDAVRCFAFSGPNGDGDICLTPDGVPASIQQGEARIELMALDRDVSSDVFEPLADPLEAQPVG